MVSFFFYAKPKRIVKFLRIGVVDKGETIVTMLKHNIQRKKIHRKTVILFWLGIYLFTILIFLVDPESEVCREGVRFSKKLYLRYSWVLQVSRF